MYLWDHGQPSTGRVACLQHSPRDSFVTLFVGACLGCWAGRQAGQKTLRRRWRDKGNVGLRPRSPVESFVCVPTFWVLKWRVEGCPGEVMGKLRDKY